MLNRGVEQQGRVPNPEYAADQRADQRARAFIALMITVSVTMQIATQRTDVAQTGLQISWPHTWTLEISSHATIFALSVLFPLVLNRAPISIFAWRWSAPIHAGAFALFTLLHVNIMYAIRLMLFPPLVGHSYNVNLLAPQHIIYEMQKDGLTYAVLMFTFVAFRAMEQRRLEAAAAVGQARTAHRITLKSGGVSFIVSAPEIITAQAAGNYVDVRTQDKSFLARMTMTALEKLLAQSGDEHIRVHRSHLANRNHIVEIKPTGDGGVDITLADGSVIPGSRRYRDRLPENH